MKIDKLYSGISIIDFDDRNGVPVQWYHGDRTLQWSDIDYSRLIENYNEMTDNGKSISKTLFNQFFSSDEIELLGDYLLEETGNELFIFELPLPLKTYIEDENGKKRFFLPEYKFEEPDNSIQLCYGENRGLHFDVSGCYTLYDEIPKGELPTEYICSGVALIRDVLKSLKYRRNYDDKKLIDIVKAIYHRTGHYVNFCVNGIVRGNGPEEAT